MSERERLKERKKLQPIEGAGKAQLYLRLKNDDIKETKRTRIISSITYKILLSY